MGIPALVDRVYKVVTIGTTLGICCFEIRQGRLSELTWRPAFPQGNMQHVIEASRQGRWFLRSKKDHSSWPRLQESFSPPGTNLAVYRSPEKGQNCQAYSGRHMLLTYLRTCNTPVQVFVCCFCILMHEQYLFEAFHIPRSCRCIILHIFDLFMDCRDCVRVM